MPTILYAEDDRHCRELFAFVLRQKDYTVYEANNGSQAVQLVRDEAIDLVILDVRMPSMSGYEAARMIAQDSSQPPVIFLSAKGRAEEIRRGFECGPMVVDYLVKPIGNDELVARVEAVLQGCHERGLASIREESMAEMVLAGQVARRAV